MSRRDINWFQSRCDISGSGCWVWRYRKSDKGYGRTNTGARSMFVHRGAYEAARGPIPAGLVIDHLCRNRACCNPAHLEAVTARENMLRGETPTARSVRSNTCWRGHEFSLENTRVRHGQRWCRACDCIRQASSKARRSPSRSVTPVPEPEPSAFHQLADSGAEAAVSTEARK